jgi:hypothetical protein
MAAWELQKEHPCVLMDTEYGTLYTHSQCLSSSLCRRFLRRICMFHTISEEEVMYPEVRRLASADPALRASMNGIVGCDSGATSDGMEGADAACFECEWAPVTTACQQPLQRPQLQLQQLLSHMEHQQGHMQWLRRGRVLAKEVSSGDS